MKDIVRKFVPSGQDVPVVGGDSFNSDKVRRVALRCSSANSDRAGDVVLQSGIDLFAFRKNPVVLWQHMYNSPIAKAVEVGVGHSGFLECVVEFPQPGISTLADQIYGLIRADIIKGVSIGFQPKESVPIDKGNPVKGPQRILQCELWEISIVTVPANADACVTWKFAEGDWRARAKHEIQQMKMASERNSLRRLREFEILELRGAVHG